MKYEIWHDESKENGYYHGIFFVPQDRRDDIIELLKIIRGEHNYPLDANLKYAGCLSKKSNGKLVSNNLHLFSRLIQSKNDGTLPMINRTQGDIYKGKCESFCEIAGLYGCKFGLLHVPDHFDSLTASDYAAKVELTFRFALKGCCHGMFSDNNPIEISKFVFDGQDHYPRSLDLYNMTKGIFRPYCAIAKDIDIDARSMKDRQDDTKIMMNLVDNIVGGWSSIINGDSDPNKILYPLGSIHQRIINGKIFSNPNSRWYKAISISELCVNEDGITFKNLPLNPFQTIMF